MNGHYLFLFHGLFSGTLAFRLLLILLRSSLSLLQEVYYLLLLDFCPYRHSVGICRAPFSWHSSITFLAELKSPPNLSNVYTRRYSVHGPDGNYSTCFCLFFLAGVLIGFSHCREGSSLIYIRNRSIGIIRGVKLANFGFLFESSFFFPMVCPTICVSFFLSWLLLVLSSLFLFPFISFASTASSAFMYFWDFRNNSATIFGRLLVIEKKKIPR